MELFTQEVKDMKELKEVLKDNNEISKNYEVALLYILLIKIIK